MPALHVRDVPEPVLAALRERASQNGRSVQEEVRQILAAAAATARREQTLDPLQLTTVRTQGTGTWGREEIYDDSGR